MKSLYRALFFAATLCVLPMSAAQAQLVNIDKDYQVTAVDPDHHRIDVHATSADVSVIHVDIDGNTQITNGTRPFNYQHLHKGAMLHIKGGLSVGLHLKAKSIRVISN